MTRTRTLLAAAALALGFAACNPYAPPLLPRTPRQPAGACQEDQPCWDCHTMGNHICGPGRG